MNETQQWKNLSAAVDDRGGNGKQTVLAMQELYNEYSSEMWEWYAGLFDAGIGGFYYSNSARDNEGFLPDIESTNQATNAMRSPFHNLLQSYDELPRWMVEKMAEFTRSLQDPNDGYMYHKQWGKNICDSRRGRDLAWSEEMAEKLGFCFDFPTATERLAKNALETENKDSALPEYLSSKESFIKYLEAMDWDNRAYYSGNMLAAQKLQIRSAGLMPVATDFLNSIQNPATGLWGKKHNYDDINAVLKIGSVYENASMPNRLKVAMSTIDYILSDELFIQAACQYNTLFVIKKILDNIDRFGEQESGERNKIVSTLLSKAPEVIESTIKKIRPFKKGQGSFSWFHSSSAKLSQEAPVAVPDTAEGDVNSTGICSGGTIRNLYAALDLSEYIVPRFGKKELERFIEIVNENQKK